jgi:hypothetical protein
MSRNAMAVSSTSCTSEFLAQQIPFSVQCLQNRRRLKSSYPARWEKVTEESHERVKLKPVHMVQALFDFFLEVARDAQTLQPIDGPDVLEEIDRVNVGN